MLKKRKEILYFDMEKIERNNEPLCESEREVAQRAYFDPQPNLYLRLDLEAALKKLPPRQRQAIELAAAGHNQEEIAQILGIRQQSANELLEKARAALKKNLQWGL